MPTRRSAGGAITVPLAADSRWPSAGYYRRMEWSVLLGALFLAAVSGFVAASDLGKGFILLGALVVLVVWQPLVAVVIAVLVTQEISTSSGMTGPTILGNSVYFTELFNLPAFFYLLVIAAVSTMFKSLGSPKTWRVFQRDLRGVWFFCIYVLIVALLNGLSLTSAVGQGVRPLLVLVLAWFVAAYSRLDVSRALVLGGGGSIVLLACIGLPAALAGGGLSLGGQLVYYDTATAAAAGAVLLTVLRLPQWSPLSLIVGAAAAVVLLVSFRRSVLVALLLIILVTALISPALRKVLLRALLAGSVIVGTGLAVFPSLVTTFWERLLISYETLEGSAADSSTEGHVNDIAVGLGYALDKPWGYGPVSRQLPGLVTKEGTLYVHNEILLSWLKFGVGGLLLVIVLLVLFSESAWRVLRSKSLAFSAGRLSGAYFILIYTVACFTAPFMMTTTRWPVLLGISLGVLSRVMPGAGAGSENALCPEPQLTL